MLLFTVAYCSANDPAVTQLASRTVSVYFCCWTWVTAEVEYKGPTEVAVYKDICRPSEGAPRTLVSQADLSFGGEPGLGTLRRKLCCQSIVSGNDYHARFCTTSRDPPLDQAAACICPWGKVGCRGICSPQATSVPASGTLSGYMRDRSSWKAKQMPTPTLLPPFQRSIGPSSAGQRY